MKRFDNNYYVSMSYTVKEMFNFNPRKSEIYKNMFWKKDPYPYIDVSVFHSEIVKELCCD